ncbi:adenylate/guanylate cyclase domain-containing protein [Fodinibius halophilus]|uniref:Adenylate/guanylate cyclase domain-containing protein n=1 Tax=Fodinibius halophilus TaxID=1736908 RepID=A0A6M1T0T1_9BACT|nr:adenylate/guanylate cyclase domain-containing protein [Fodinibius halophilus]NGP89698.1 adenylate/guanylate cyclase domain-containing protein [Fodinibius halophilus]
MKYTDFTSRLENAFESYYQQASNNFSVQKSVAEAKNKHSNIVEQYELQRLFRPLYGKEGVGEPSIGDHPDFEHLRDSKEIEHNSITTLFMDIVSSTRLGLLYSPQEVYQIKNAFIRASIELIKAFDGHVHRIMGDAVMAYFGGKNTSDYNDIINALNCSAVIRYFVEKVVAPNLETKGFEDSFGIRIGLDYGKESDVIWSAYGFPGIDEVTATSFYVDVASKLQHSAGSNQIMIGKSLKKEIDFPEDLLDVKQVTRNGKKKPEPYLKPNLTNSNGDPINYNQYLLSWKKYLAYSPIGHYDHSFFNETDNSIELNADISKTENGIITNDYKFTSRVLSSDSWIRFNVNLSKGFVTPYTVKFKVENHGLEAYKAGKLKDSDGSDYQNHEKVYTVENNSKTEINHWEGLEYRGLHYMFVEITTALGVKHKAQCGVYID